MHTLTYEEEAALYSEFSELDDEFHDIEWNSVKTDAEALTQLNAVYDRARKLIRAINPSIHELSWLYDKAEWLLMYIEISLRERTSIIRDELPDAGL